MLQGDFTQNMGRVFIIYTGGCLGFGALLALLSWAGLSDRLVGIGFVGGTILFYALIGVLGRGGRGGDDHATGRRIPALYTGMATAADWMSAASFIGMAGAIYAAGFDGLAFVLGWSGGYILVAVLLAPYLRKFGQYTVPDFLGARYGGRLARRVGIVVLVTVGFAYLVGQLTGSGIIAARFLGLDFPVAVFVGLAGILVCALLGGMRAVIWAQLAQYMIVILAYLLPVVLLSQRETGVPLPHLMYGEILQRAAALGQLLGETAADAFAPTDRLNFFALVLCLMLGTASLPHLLARYFITPSVRDARVSVAWSLLFIALLYLTAPAYAAFARLEVLQHVVAPALGTATALPAWAEAWSATGLAGMVDGHFHIDPDAIVLATPEIAGLPFVVAGLVAAGGLAAALSSANGLLLSIASSLSPPAAGRRFGRRELLMVAIGLLAALVASLRPAGLLTLVGWAFSLAASGLFAALVLGIWWKRTTQTAAILGMAAGWATCLGYILATQTGAMAPWFGLHNIAAGIFGLPVSLLVTVAVSLITRAPSPQMQAFIDSIRIPRGRVRLVEPPPGK